MVNRPAPKAYECYPWSSLLIYNAFCFAQYIIGFILVELANPILGKLFIAYIVYLEVKLYKEGCRHCYYYGKRCFGGRGNVAKLFLKKGDPKKFAEKEVTGKSLIPQMLLLILPTAAGAWMLYQGFSFLILGLVTIPWIIWFVVTPQIYGKMACPHCKQGRICCPANEFFSKKFGSKAEGDK